MKKFNIIFVLIMILASSCEEYLDVPRESLDISEEDIFSNYLEYDKYTSSLYSEVYKYAYYHSYGARNGGEKFSGFPVCATDQLVPFAGYMFEDRWFDVPNFSQFYCNDGSTHHNIDLWYSAWRTIRIANVSIQNIELLQDATEEQKNQLLGQAYFGRAFTYSFFLQLFGGMPYLDHPLGSEDSWDLERLSYHETVRKIAADCDMAATLLPARWDNPNSSSPDYLSTRDVSRFTSVAALALKSRVLLYDASPRYNTENDIARWVDAAKASYDAVTLALLNGHRLLDENAGDKYTDNFWGKDYTEETILRSMSNARVRHAGTWEMARTYYPNSITTKSAFNAGLCVTQNLVDKFEAVERHASGSIIRSLSLQDAKNEGYFNSQDPFNDRARDPRFYSSIIHHGTTITKPSRTFNMTEGSNDLIQMAGNNVTGYYVGKWWNGGTDVTGGNNITTPMIAPLIRLAEIFLNLAEAANEAYGPDGAAAGMTARDAINAVRERVGMPEVDTRYSSKELFRQRVRNEREVELCFESNHSFADTRRWDIIDTDEYRNIYKIRITPDGFGNAVTYPTGYVFEKVLLQTRPFDERLYFFPVPKFDVDKMPSFKQNPGY